MMNRQQSFIPGQQNQNQAMQMMQQYQQFRKDYLAQNQNPDAKSAVMDMVGGQMNNPALQQAMQIARMCGFKV